MTPVEPTRTCSLSIPKNSAAFSAVSSQCFSPSLPVPAFAIPVLTTIARTGPFFSLMISLSHSTGAALTTFFVKVPAEVQSFSEYTIAISSLSLYLTPAATADALNPLAAVTPPSMAFIFISSSLDPDISMNPWHGYAPSSIPVIIIIHHLPNFTSSGIYGKRQNGSQVNVHGLQACEH